MPSTSSSEIESRLRKILAQALGDGRRAAGLRPEQTLRNELGMNSVAMLSMLASIEEEFSLDLAELEFEPTEFRTVGDVLSKGAELISRASS
jgi:acyl carrier protein